MSSQMFELFFRRPGSGADVAMIQDIARAEGHPITHAQAVLNARTNGEFEVCTKVRAFDAKSYHFCRLLVRERAFGMLNKRHFFFRNLSNGVEYVLDSKEVASACGTTPKEPYFRLTKIRATSAS